MARQLSAETIKQARLGNTSAMGEINVIVGRIPEGETTIGKTSEERNTLGSNIPARNLILSDRFL